jgi:spermidine synthase
MAKKIELQEALKTSETQENSTSFQKENDGLPPTSSKITERGKRAVFDSKTFLLVFLFFVSGFSALIYQITWQRLLALFSGFGHYTITVIVTAFMAGLGIGSYLSGFYADRISQRKSILSFAACEILIAFFALASPAFFYDLVYLKFGFLAEYTGAIPVIHFLALFLPTFMMGASLPLLSKGLVSNIERASQTIGLLYGLNTLGAGAGSLATVYLLLPRMSIPDVIYFAAALNASIGLLVLLLYRNFDADVSIAKPTGLEAIHDPNDISKIRIWFGLAFIAGFVALAYEMVWFRTLWVALKVNPQTFGSVLGILLLCMGMGSIFGVCFIRRFNFPKRLYLLTQWLMGVVGALIILWFCYGSKEWGYLKSAFSYWGGADFFTPAYHKMGFYSIHILLPLLMLGLPSAAMGFTFPLLQKIVQLDTQHIGRRVGRIGLCIILGNILGSLVTGTILFKYIGTSQTLAVIVAMSSIFGFCAFVRNRNLPLFTSMMVAVVSIGLACLIPGNKTFWSVFHGTDSDNIAVSEDLLGLIAYKKVHNGDILHVQGRYMARLPFADNHIMLGAVPVLIHSNPEEVLIIGFGSGGVAWGAGCSNNVRSISCYEVMKGEIDILNEMNLGKYPGVQQILSDPRFKITYSDGRLALLLSDKKYDVIELDVWNDNAFSSTLLSVEFYSLVKKRLKTTGLFCTSLHYSDVVINTAASVFPYVTIIKGLAVFGFQPLKNVQNEIQKKISDPEVRAYFNEGGFDIEDFAAAISSGEIRTFKIQQKPFEDRSNLNTDLFPQNEFLLRYPDLF